MTAQDTRALRKALVPFAALGRAYIKHGDGDTSPFAQAADDERLYFGSFRDGPWYVTVGQLRAASVAYDAAEQITWIKAIRSAVGFVWDVAGSVVLLLILIEIATGQPWTVHLAHALWGAK